MQTSRKYGSERSQGSSSLEKMEEGTDSMTENDQKPIAKSR